MRPAPQEPASPRESTDAEFRPPRPLRTAALLFPPLLLPVVLWLADMLRAPAALALGAFLVLIAVVRTGFSVSDLHRSRRLGDALLRSSDGDPAASALTAWRSTELTSTRNRRALLGPLRRLERETEACTSPSVRTVDRTLVDESLAALRKLETRLELTFEPVSPLGVLELHALVMGDFSPLYYPERIGQLPDALSRALDRLDPR
jgi:hypothetical protein